MTEKIMRENYTLPRLYVPDALAADVRIDLPREQAHYLTNVIRKSVGDSVRVFNGAGGEWRAEIEAIAKKSAQLVVSEQLRPPQTALDVTLLFAPVRKHRTAFIIEKGTELGVRTFQPVLTSRTQFPRLNIEKARLQAIEAAEQTERLDIPDVREVKPLLDVLAAWDDTPILFADEAGDAGDARAVCTKLTAPLAILVGPEGGFTEAERKDLRALSNVHPMTLGPRILRADTAAIALLSVWQSVNGDW